MSWRVFNLNGNVPQNAGVPEKVKTSILVGTKTGPAKFGRKFGCFKTVNFSSDLGGKTAQIATVPFTRIAIASSNGWRAMQEAAAERTMKEIGEMLLPSSTQSMHVQYRTADGKMLANIVFGLDDSNMFNGEVKERRLGVTVTTVAKNGTILSAQNCPVYKVIRNGAEIRLKNRTFQTSEKAEIVQYINEYDVQAGRRLPLEYRLWRHFDRDVGITTLGGISSDDVLRIGQDSVDYFKGQHKCTLDGWQVSNFRNTAKGLKPGEKKVMAGNMGMTKAIFMERLEKPDKYGKEYSFIFIQDEGLAAHFEKALETLAAGKPYIFQQGDRLARIASDTVPMGFIVAGRVNMERSMFTVEEQQGALYVKKFDKMI